MFWKKIAALSLVLQIPASLVGHDAPLPDPKALRARAIASAKALGKDREKYSCIVREETAELNGDGSVKQKKVVLKDRFFVNGLVVDHVLERDGKPLTGAAAKNEQSHTDSEVKKLSDPKKVVKEEAQQERQIDDFLVALRFNNGRREARGGRSLITYELTGDPNFHPRKLIQRFAQALTGRIWVDEETGVPVEVKLETARDVKIIGGLVANLHKGFHLHLIQERQPDGVWLTKSAEGSGDARAALFISKRFRFREDLQQCHLYGVNADQKARAPK